MRDADVEVAGVVGRVRSVNLLLYGFQCELREVVLLTEMAEEDVLYVRVQDAIDEVPGAFVTEVSVVTQNPALQ